MSERRNQSPSAISLGIVDNDPFALQAMDILIRRQRSPIAIAWTCLSCAEALEFCSAIECPQVILTDLRLDGLDGFELSRQVKLKFPMVGVVGITAFVIPENQVLFQRSQIDSIIQKDSPIEDIIRAIGRASHCSVLAQWTSYDQASPLSGMELRIVRMVSRGFTYASIGRQLHISEPTVKTYMNRIYDKLGVHTRSECIAYCATQGLLS